MTENIDSTKTCWLCDIKSIKSKLKPLCWGCYVACKEQKLLHLFPTFSIRQDYKKYILDRKGKEFVDDLYVLKAGNTTLDKVGKKYGVTRERIRQIYNKYFDELYAIAVAKRGVYKSILAEKEAAKKRKPAYKYAHAKGSNSNVAFLGEYKFYSKCLSLGYSIESHPLNKPYDFIVNNHKVDVKTCRHTIPKKQKTSYYNANLTKKQLDETDFIAMYITPMESFFIIPRTAYGKSVSLYIPKEVSNYHNSGTGYREYKDKWELLK